ncbi:MAG: hypothetical protein E6Q32_09615 [Neisseriales bacterium]|nr:MAG: hypothetical protein E6Q32_09615 [Neisseriales bacterium]
MTTDNIISSLNAQSIYEKHVKDVDNNTITSVQGEFGVGKSTTKKYLIERIKNNINKSICVEYNALQYEEAGQITSQFYTEIGTKLSICNRLKLYACAILKKENPNASYITGNLGVIGILSATIALIWHYMDESIIEKFNTNCILLVLLLFALLIFGFRNELVEIFSSLLPRKSHVQILKNLDTSEFKDAPLFIFVDELDRIDAKSLQLLLNEILILHEILDSIKVQHRFFLFYNLNSVRNTLRGSDIVDVDFYLQKYIHNGFKIYKPDFSHALHSKIYNSIRSEKIVTTGEALNNSTIFSNPLADKKQIPSSEILMVINKNLLSFRDLERFISFLLTNAYGISNALISDFNLNSVKLNEQFKVDITIIILFLDYKHQKNLHDLSIDNKSIQQNKIIYNLLLDFEKIIQALYDCSLFSDSELKAQISSEANKNIFTSELDHISLRYYDVSRVYPSTVENGKVDFNIDYENRLEHIFSEYNYRVNNGSSLIDYIEANLGEFYTSKQVGYPYYLDHLGSMSLLLNETNIDAFMGFILELEKRLIVFFKREFSTFEFTTEHSANLYDAAINSVIYCLAKLLPSDPDKFNKIINLFTTYVNTQPHFSSSLLFYLGLSRVTSRYHPALAANRNNVLKLLHEIEILDINFSDNEFNFLFLYEYFDTIRKRNNYRTNHNFNTDRHGNILNKLSNVLTSIDIKNSVDTFYYGLFFVIGLLLYSKNQNISLKKDGLIIGEIKNTIRPWTEPILTQTIEYKNKQLHKDMIEILNLFK